MAETEKIKILSLEVGTEGAVKNIADLKSNISQLKEILNDSEATFEENAEAAELLRKNQAALRDAMYSTATSATELVESSAKLIDETGKVNGSYNELVHTMADLKSAWRATKDETERASLGEAIDKINSKLKEMDKSVGNFSRNVGDYEGSIKRSFTDITKGMSEQVDSFRKGLQSMGGGLNGMKDGLEGISKSPAVATIGILVSLAMKLGNELKDNEQVMAAVKKALTALKPVMDFFSGVLDTIINYLVELIGKAGAWLGSSGFFSKLVDGLVGVGNAILQFVIAPFKGVVAAIKVFQEEGIKGIGRAAKAFGQEMKSGVAFKSNYQAGQAAADAMVSGMESRRKKVADTAGSIAKEAAETSLADWKKALAEGEKRSEEARKLLEEQQKQMDDWVQSETDAIVAEIDAYMEEQERLDAFDQAMSEARIQRMKEEAEQRAETWMQAAAVTSSVLGSIADLYESDEANAEKNAAKVKGLRIASATIDTISGAVAAYMNAQKTGLPPYISIPLGVASAASVTAAGMAQIAKIKSTNPTGGSGSVSVSTAAPAPVLSVPEVRTLTSSQDLERLGDVVSDQRVYILSSDLEADRKSTRAKVQESSY